MIPPKYTRGTKEKKLWQERKKGYLYGEGGHRSELSKLSNYKDRLKYMGWYDCLLSQEILTRYTEVNKLNRSH